jgi:hypothetical protein
MVPTHVVPSRVMCSASNLLQVLLLLPLQLAAQMNFVAAQLQPARPCAQVA